jgi:hypothetical protein
MLSPLGGVGRPRLDEKVADDVDQAAVITQAQQIAGVIQKRETPEKRRLLHETGEGRAYRELKDKESTYAWEWRLPGVSSSAYWPSSTFQSWLVAQSRMVFDCAG